MKRCLCGRPKGGAIAVFAFTVLVLMGTTKTPDIYRDVSLPSAGWAQVPLFLGCVLAAWWTGERVSNRAAKGSGFRAWRN